MTQTSPNSPATITAELDEDWFEDHPGRFIRLRHKTDGDPGIDKAMLVFHASPGVWFHFPLSLSPKADAWPILQGAAHTDVDLERLLKHAISVYFAHNKPMARALLRSVP